jgi:non-specific serine/threonine protein kinase
MTGESLGESRLYRWRFGVVEFDEARRELRIAGLAVEIEHKPLEVLSLLLRHAGEVVTKAELFDTVWAGRVTVDHVLATAIGKLRKALDATGESRIATVPRIGYRFDGQVERMAVGATPASPLALEAGQPVPGRDHFVLERQLGRTLGSEVWLARQPRSRDQRVFKFALDGEHLASIKREATLLRVLRETLGERGDFVRMLDWNFESPPFFLESEYAGQALSEWADEGERLPALSRDQRIALFLQVADALAAAHGVGVLHKDMKPANLLIAARDGGGWHVRLSDFGSSRLLQPERLAELGITRLGFTLTQATKDSSSGTPLYLAPELLAGHPPTVRSDVYALGVILYQLLAGNLHKPLAPGWERDIDDPLLREDIAAATDTDASHRIASADDLAERLRRLPDRHAARARQLENARAAETLRSTLERNRMRRPWVITAFATLALGLGLSVLFWQRSEQQQHIARQQAARAEASLQVFNQALATLSTGRSGYGHDPTIREMLEYVSSRGTTTSDPRTSGDVHVLLGRSWRLLGEPARGAVEYRAAVRDYAHALGERHELTLKTRYALVRTLAYMQTPQSFAEAAVLLQETDRLAGARLLHADPLALQAALERGIYHLSRMQAGSALSALQRADLLQRRLAPDDAGTAALIRTNIADALRRSGKPAQALDWIHTAQADPLLSPERIGRVSVALMQWVAAHALNDLGRHSEALPMARAAVATSRKFLGPDDYLTLTQLSLVAEIQSASSNCTAALPLARDVSQRMLRRFGEAMQASLVEIGNLGRKEIACGDRQAGVEHLQRAIDALHQHFGRKNPAAQGFGMSLAEALIEQRQRVEAGRPLANGDGAGQ